MDLVTVNVRGTVFMVDHELIRDKVDSSSPLLDLSGSSAYYNCGRGEVYFNRNAAVFDCVLDYLSTGELHVPRNICPVKIRHELKFWGVPLRKVEKCCWETFYQTEEDLDIIHKLLATISSCGSVREQTGNNKISILSNVYYKLYGERESLPGKIWYGVQCVVIMLSTLLFIMASVPMCRVDMDNPAPYPFPIKTDLLELYWTTRPHFAILPLEGICNFILSVDWLLRFCCSQNKRMFMRNFLNSVELVAWIMNWFFITVEHLRTFSYHLLLSLYYSDDSAVTPLAVVWFVTGLLYSTRVFRIFRMIHNNTGVQILHLSIKSSARELFVLAVHFTSASILFAVIVYMAELTTIPKSSFTDVPITIWWAFVTMTTVGYGDLYPTSPQGYCVGILCALLGILLIALPVAVTSSNFRDFYTFNKYRVRHEQSLKTIQENCHKSTNNQNISNVIIR